MSWQELPEELWLAVLSHLQEMRDVLAAALVCRQWWRLTQDPFLETERVGSLFLLGTTVLDFSRLMVVAHDHAAAERVREALLGCGGHGPAAGTAVTHSPPTCSAFDFANWDEYERMVKQDGKYVACLVMPPTTATATAGRNQHHHRHHHRASLSAVTNASSPLAEGSVLSVKMLHMESSKVLWEVSWPSREGERLVCFFQDKLKVWIVKERSIAWHIKRTGRLGNESGLYPSSREPTHT